MEDAVTTTRLATLASSGFESEAEMMDAMLYFVHSLGTNLMGEDVVSEEQKRGIAAALNDVPATVEAFRNVIASLPCSREEKSDLTFILARLMDDLISLGSVAMLDKNTRSHFDGASRGGKRSAEVRKQKSEDEWRAAARPRLKAIREKMPTLSQSDLAYELIARWKDDPIPVHSSVETLIREMEKEGQLPRKT